MGTFDDHYTSVPDDLPWWHCMTVPRVLSRRADGHILQTPVPELEQLRGSAQELQANKPLDVAGRMADIALDDIGGEGTLNLDDSFQVFYEQGRLGIRYLDEKSSAGRTERSIPLQQLDDLRVLVDGSAVEIFANAGAQTFASRWFCPQKDALCLASTFAAQGVAYAMADTMSEMYATAQAPDLAMPGWNQTVTQDS